MEKYNPLFSTRLNLEEIFSILKGQIPKNFDTYSMSDEDNLFSIIKIQDDGTDIQKSVLINYSRLLDESITNDTEKVKNIGTFAKMIVSTNVDYSRFNQKQLNLLVTTFRNFQETEYERLSKTIAKPELLTCILAEKMSFSDKVELVKYTDSLLAQIASGSDNKDEIYASLRSEDVYDLVENSRRQASAFQKRLKSKNNK